MTGIGTSMRKYYAAVTLNLQIGTGENTGQARIDVADLPAVDPATQDGRDYLGAVAAEAHRIYPEICHFVFIQGNEVVVGVIFAPAKEDMN